MRPEKSTLSSRHIASLDGVRGIAVLLVLLHHLSAGSLPNRPGGWHLLGKVLFQGWTGVDLFFVLSGFLITGILLDTKHASNYFQSFYVRRVLRIFPLFYLVLIALIFLSHAISRAWLKNVLPLPHDQSFYFFYLNNWLPRERQGTIIGHFWSLAVEEQFYLVWPLCIWLLPRKRILMFAFGGIAASILLRIGLIGVYGATPTISVNTFTRGLDPLLIGAALAYLAREPELLFRCKRYIYIGGLLGLAGFAAIVVGFGPAPRGWEGAELPIFLALSCGMFILHAFITRADRTWFQIVVSNPVHRSFGKYSYGIYVYHVPLLMISSRLYGNRFKIGEDPFHSIVFCLGVIGASYLVAKLSFDLFESRFLKLKRWFVAEPVPPVQIAAAANS